MPFGKGRTPDKPGTYRIKPAKGGGIRLSGLRSDGSRVRMTLGSESEANDIAGRLFPRNSIPFLAVETSTETKVDDWGFPIRVSDDSAASVAQTLNIPQIPSHAAITKIADKPPEESPEEKARKAERIKNAKSLMDLAGIAVAWGDVTLGQKLCERVGKDPVKPDTAQVNDLRKNTKEALVDLFGDSEISPWKMAILLAIGIPLSMLIQSPRKKVIEPEKKPDLKSVP